MKIRLLIKTIVTGKKAYVPPYTPKATVGSDTKDDKVKVSSSGLSRSLVIEPVKKAGQQARNNTTPARATVNRTSSQSKDTNSQSGSKNNSSIAVRPVTKKTKSKNVSDDEEAPSTREYSY